MKTTIISILTLSLSFSTLYAVEKTDTIKILFHQGHSEIDPTLRGNSTALSRLDSIFSPEGTKLRNIQIIGGASPEGSVHLNNNLSDKRAEKILSLLPCESQEEKPAIELSFVGRDWQSLLECVESDPNVPYKSETITLLKEINAKLSGENGEREADDFLNSLKELKGGIPYRYLYYNTFPSLRASRVYLSYYALPSYNADIEGPALTIDNPFIDANIIIPRYDMIETLPKKKRNFYMALKTNMLYDALALPSLSAEFYLGKNFSAVANWTYGWWDTDRTHHYWRAYGGDIAVRWWFGKKALEKPLTGHHIGVYGGIFTYDFEFGGTGYMGGLPHETLWNRSLRMAGIEYGYSLPVAKRLNIDFTIGIGYMGGKYIKYIPDNGRYLWQSTHKINWFGPTKAEVSLVWLIGPGNCNLSKKGGEK
ncbi:MAG: DUF3575 domain-containing protein [Muribaculaceae bacterium]|nr:DUF3575 domain-containing protein [Muribaculaceae bacterium]